MDSLTSMPDSSASEGITTWNDGVSGITGGGRNGFILKALKFQLRSLCDNTDFVVEADSYARVHLNRRWSPNVNWEFDPRCYTVEIGSFAGNPIAINMQFAKINGKRIMFYSPCSAVVNYDMIDKWLLANCNPTRFGGLERAHVNAENFHRVIDFCR